MTQEMLEAARAYTKKGWIVHPLWSPKKRWGDPKLDKSAGKRPILDDWSQRSLATEQELINWFSDTSPDIRFRDCNIGLVCGIKSNVTDMDLDSMLFKEEILYQLDIDDINTLKSGRITGRGHILSQFVPELAPTKHHDLGIEILNNGSNSVLPPSIHFTGAKIKWSNPDAPLMVMPKRMISNIQTLFKIEQELKSLLNKTRTCFRTTLKKDKNGQPLHNFHGGEGREYMLAICTDLKKAGAQEQHITMFAKLIYQSEYNEKRTLSEWRHIDESKTWTCEKLKSKLSTYTDPEQCAECDKRRESWVNKTSNHPVQHPQQEPPPAKVTRIKCEGFQNAAKGVEGTITCQRVAESIARGYLQWKDAPEETTMKILKKFCKLCHPPLDFDTVQPMITELYDVPFAMPVCDNMILAGLCELSQCKTMVRHRQEEERLAFLQLKEIMKQKQQQAPSLIPVDTNKPEEHLATTSCEVTATSITTESTDGDIYNGDKQRILASVKSWRAAKGKNITTETLPDVLEWVFHNTGISTSITRKFIVPHKTIKLQKDIPDFIGMDGELYQLKTGTVTSIPEINAKALIKRQAAVEIIDPLPKNVDDGLTGDGEKQRNNLKTQFSTAKEV